MYKGITQRSIINKPASVFVWNNLYIGIDWVKKQKKVITQDFVVVSNKVQEVSLKILHRCYPVNSVIVKYRLNVDPLCSFCHHTDGMIIHLFWDCTFSQTFWFLNRKLDTQIQNLTYFIWFCSWNACQENVRYYLFLNYKNSIYMPANLQNENSALLSSCKILPGY